MLFRVSLSILLSAWRPAAPVKLCPSTWDFGVPVKYFSIRSSRNANLSRVVRERRRRPEATTSSFARSFVPARRLHHETRFGESTDSSADDKREPTSYLRSRGSIFSNSTLFSQKRELRNREGVDPNGSLGGVHLSFYHPHSTTFAFRWPNILRHRPVLGRRIAPYLRTTISRNPPAPRVLKAYMSPSRLPAIHPPFRFVVNDSRVIP